MKKKKRKNTQIVKRNWIFFTFYFVEFIYFFIFYWGFHNFIISIFPFLKKNTTIHFYEHVF